MKRLLAPVAALGLAVACSGEIKNAAPTTTAPERSNTTTEAVAEQSPLCLALSALEATLLTAMDPTEEIQAVQAAAGFTPEGGYPITNEQSVDQLGDILGAISTAELTIPGEVPVGPGDSTGALIDQALEATGAALNSNCANS